MVKVTFLPENKSCEVEEGTTLLQAAREAGIVIESPCGGAVTCGKCKVKLAPNSLQNIVKGSSHHLSREDEAQGFVLACETRVIGDVLVSVIPREHNKSLKILNKGKIFNIKIDSFIKKVYSQEEKITRIYGDTELLGVEEGDTSSANYGIVVDIGTTTVVTALVDLHSGKELTSTSALNPQAIHAQDVLSRIKFASEEQGLNIMHSELIQEINRMIKVVTEETGIKKEFIYEGIFSGNTCMLHLAAKVNPASLGKYPYTPGLWGGSHLKAEDYQLEISKFGRIYFPPIISAFVGADITAGILASKLHEKKGVTLFVDIGTNGEMVIASDGKLSSTSTAAGPAFEGMNITHGMRAGNGAIELFNVEEDGSVTIKTIGDQEAVGICGSGLLDIVGELVAYGVIDERGRFIAPETEEIPPSLKGRVTKKDNKTVFKVTDKVFLSQKDVRQVQLAKGAVRAGIEFLLQDKGLKAADVDQVLIAGSFGYHLRAKSLINIGLLPAEFEGKIDFIGNTSKSGGQAFLLSKGYREDMKKLVQEIDVIELANYKDFDKVFVKCLSFKEGY